MENNKKKAAAVAAVTSIIQTEKICTCICEPSAWNQQGKQTIMANRNNMQMRYIRKNK